MLDTSAPGQIGTRTNRHPDNLASQLDKSTPQKDKLALVFFSLISLPLIVIVCILPVFFFFLKSCFDLFDKSITLSCKFYGLVSIIQDYVGWGSLYMH